jgi:hypothetical protein
MSQKQKLTQKFYVRLTDQQAARIEEIRVRRGAYSTAEILREAAVEFIENESDAISSRRHFARSLQQHINRLEEQMQVIFAFQTMLMAGQFKEIHEMASDEGDEAVTVEQLLTQASRETITQFFKVRALLGTLVQSKQKAEDAARQKAK